MTRWKVPKLTFINLIKLEFQSSQSLTEEFAYFSRVFANEFRGYLTKTFGAHNVEIRRGHFYIYGFFTMPPHHTAAREGYSEAEMPEQAWYFSIGDVRGFKTMMIRRARDYYDFTGGHNKDISLQNEEEFDRDMRSALGEA